MDSSNRITGLASGMDTDSMVKAMMAPQQLKATQIQNKITTLQWTQDMWKSLNAKIYSFYTGPLSKMKMQGTFSTKNVSSSDDTKASVTADVTATNGTQTLKVLKLASAQFVTGDQLNSNIALDTKLTDIPGIASDDVLTIKTSKGDTPITIDDKTTVGDFINDLKTAGLNASYDTNQNRIFISSKDSGSQNAFSITGSAAGDMTALGLSALEGFDGTTSIPGVTAASDSKINLNGADITGSSNTIKVNGLSLNVKGLTAAGETINLTVSNNTQAVYDSVKAFVKNYNDILNELNTDYNAPSSKGYDPLTADQKSSMSQTQIDQWEKKIKDSLLRRDDTVSSLTESMRDTTGEIVNVNGKSYSLASFGIGSLSYTEKGTLHIDGDSDDNMTSGKVNKLMDALTNDPDTVMQVINKMAGDLYSKITDDMKGSTLRSSLTVYNDKEMTKTMTQYQKDLTTMNAKLKDMEDRYYKQFSDMETAMSKLNQQSSSLASMLGTNTNQK